LQSDISAGGGLESRVGVAGYIGVTLCAGVAFIAMDGMAVGLGVDAQVKDFSRGEFCFQAGFAMAFQASLVASGAGGRGRGGLRVCFIYPKGQAADQYKNATQAGEPKLFQFPHLRPDGGMY
jgi:hypothetical protein